MRVARQIALLSLLCGLLLVVQSTLSLVLGVQPWMPDLVIPVLVLLGLTRTLPLVQGSVASFCVGFLVDSFSGNSLGVHAFVMVLVFLLARVIGSRLSFRGLPVQLLFTFLLALCSSALLWLVRGVFGPVGFPADLSVFASSMFVNALMTALFAPLVFLAARPIILAFSGQREEAGL